MVGIAKGSLKRLRLNSRMQAAAFTGVSIVVLIVGAVLAAPPETQDSIGTPSTSQPSVVPTDFPSATPSPATATTPPQQPQSMPTPAPRVTAQPARAQPAPFSLSGSGQQATETFSIAGGVTIFRLTHQGSSNFAVWLKDGSSGENVELLVNTIGSFNGSKLVGVPEGTYLLDVSADGSWKVIIEQPRPASAEGAPQTLSGPNQAAAGPIQLRSGLARFALKHSGDGNFAVWLIDDSGENVALLANDIGRFDGSKAEHVSDGIYWFDVSANGNWSIAVSQ
jgi:hypothetical protein